MTLSQGRGYTRKGETGEETHEEIGNTSKPRRFVMWQKGSKDQNTPGDKYMLLDTLSAHDTQCSTWKQIIDHVMTVSPKGRLMIRPLTLQLNFIEVETVLRKNYPKFVRKCLQVIQIFLLFTFLSSLFMVL